MIPLINLTMTGAADEVEDQEVSDEIIEHNVQSEHSPTTDEDDLPREYLWQGLEGEDLLRVLKAI